MKWQPIATAPMEGDVLVYESGEYRVTCRTGWDPNLWYGPDGHNGYYMEPTHWMPLPDPPETA